LRGDSGLGRNALGDGLIACAFLVAYYLFSKLTQDEKSSK